MILISICNVERGNREARWRACFSPARIRSRFCQSRCAKSPKTRDMSERRLRMGVAGLGRAFTLMLPTLLADRRIELVAAADPRPEAARRFAAEFGARTYDGVEALCANPDVEVVYVATPHEHHAAHVAMATSHGKHVLVEKPMAITLTECG